MTGPNDSRDEETQNKQMTSEEFIGIRKELNKTQQQMARLLGGSVKAVCSYEQGWRSIPVHAQRQMLFLLYLKTNHKGRPKPCWEIIGCPDILKLNCPAWEFNAGHICWFINGTICSGRVQANWTEKIRLCKRCKAFPAVLKNTLNP